MILINKTQLKIKGSFIMLLFTILIFTGCSAGEKTVADRSEIQSIRSEFSEEVSVNENDESINDRMDEKEANNGSEIAETEEEPFYKKLANGEAVNILIVGDSIGLGSGASGTEERWTFLLSEYLKEKYGSEVTLTNLSMGGNSSYAGYVRTMTLDDDIEYDAAIICYGHNDSKKTFSLHYESIIRALRSKYPAASLISILESSQKEYNAKMQMIKELAEHYEIPLADTIEPFQNRHEELTVDDVHPNDAGHRIYVETVENVIDEKTENLPSYHSKNIEPVNEEVSIFDSFKWYGADEFERNGNSYSLKTNIIGKVLGLDYSLFSGDNNCKILIDGKEFVEREISFDYDFNERFIVIVNEEWNEDPLIVKNEIEIVFSDDESGREQADGFMGIAVSGIST